MNMVRILSIENWHTNRSWSWGLVVDRLIENLSPEYQFLRIRRGQFQCPNPKCHNVFGYDVDVDMCNFFDVLFPQNVDTLRMIPHGEKIVARIGGLNMDNPSTQRYAEDLKRVAHVIATNQQLADIASEANPNCTVIPNGVDLDHFKPADPNPNLDRQGFMLGFAGNIWGGGADYKGWQPYVQACARLMSDGVQQTHLLHGTNQIPNSEMPEKFYHLIDALVLPSKGEGCSNVVSEALACGVPVLCTKVGYHGEMLENEKNVLFIERDHDSIITQVKRLLTNPTLRVRLCENGRLFAEQYHDVKKIAARYDEIFKSVLAKTRERQVSRDGNSHSEDH